MQGLRGHSKDFAFYSEGSAKSLEEQRNDMI